MPNDLPAKSPLVSRASIHEFFHDAVVSAVANQHVDLSDDASSYLVNLLIAYADANVLFEDYERGVPLKPLAEFYAQVHEARSELQRERHLRRLGDVALFFSGVFADCFSHRVVDVDYYVAMGEGAYGSLADSGSLTFSAPVFHELATHFVQCMDVLAEASDNKQVRSDTDILRCYEVWLRTGSQRAAKELHAKGIAVFENNSSRAQH